MSPEDKKQIEGKKIEDVAKQFEKNSADFLEQLKAAQKTKPVMENNGEKAVYKDMKVKGGEATIALIKVGKLWYLSGKDTKKSSSS